MIHLDLESAGLAARNVQLAELFVVAHELGHFVNGDLTESSRFAMVGSDGWLARYVENADHLFEY